MTGNIYHPIKDGFEITNGSAVYVRPLYSTHAEDLISDRYLYLAGDKPDVVVSRITGSVRRKYAHLFLGIQGGKWLSAADKITARYVEGHLEYDITDSSFAGVLRLTMIRTDLFDGLILKAQLPDSLRGRIQIAVAGDGAAKNLDFIPEDVRGTAVELSSNAFYITKEGCQTVSGVSSVPITYTITDAAEFERQRRQQESKAGREEGGSACLKDNLIRPQESGVCGKTGGAEKAQTRDGASQQPDAPMVIGTPQNTAADIYFLLTTQDILSPAIQEFLQKPEKAVASGRAYYRGLLDKVKVETPDEKFDSSVAAQLIGMDAAWSGKTIMHGSFRWYVPHSGWRSAYGETVAGFSDRVKKNAEQFFAAQDENGRILDFPTGDKRYNMGEVMVDQLLYNWRWDGDLSFFENGGYDFIKNYLRFEENFLGVPGTDLYENWLNAWNTDNKWCNGGAGTIASSYMWRAHTTMADIAARLGKEEDAQNFAAKAEAIKADMKKLLWDEKQGVYAEYRDRFGNGLLHACPDLSSIYTPIDEGVTDLEESLGMLQYAEEHFQTLDGLDEGEVFPYASDWLPHVYSSNGLYPAEVLHTALAYFQTGQAEKGYAYLKGVMHAFFNGETAGPGLACHEVNEKAENDGNTDFADVCSMFIRTVVEGVFGIHMNLPENTVTIMPGLPADWDHAAIQTDAVSCRYACHSGEETLKIESRDALIYQLQICLNGKAVREVFVNGEAAAYMVENGRLLLKTKPGRSAEVAVCYEAAAGEGAPAAATGETLPIVMAGENVSAVMADGTEPAEAVLTGEATSMEPASQKGAAAAKSPDPAQNPEKIRASVSQNTAFKTVCLDSVVNQNLADLHRGTYTISFDGRDDYILPRFYFVRDTTRGVTANGRAWWETGRGADEQRYAPVLDRLPLGGGILETEIGVPFAVSDAAGQNAVFASMYHQFPERVTIPVGASGRRLYFLLCVSTNHMQSYVENAVLTAQTAKGTQSLSLVNPLNIDDWLNYQTAAPYALSGCIQPLGEKAHANILCMDLGSEVYIESVSLTCVANEVLAGILGITVGV